MSNAFVGVILLSGLGAAYFFIRLIIAAIKKEPTSMLGKKLLAAMAVGIIGFVGFGVTQTPEEKAEIKARQEARVQTEVEKVAAEQKAAEEARLAREQADKAKAEKERQAAEVQKAVEEQKQQDAIKQELKTGWNVTTTDTAEDNTNLMKASTLVVKYPNHIHEAPANWIDAAVAMKKPWDYYGQVVNLHGRIYSIEQLPPANPARKFFGGDCYEAMLAIDEEIAVSLIIVGDSSGISENSQINIKGYIYGHSKLVNGLGGQSRGLAFVGFAE